jgi:hypothetical protein
MGMAFICETLNRFVPSAFFTAFCSVSVKSHRVQARLTRKRMIQVLLFCVQLQSLWVSKSPVWMRSREGDSRIRRAEDVDDPA